MLRSTAKLVAWMLVLALLFAIPCAYAAEGESPAQTLEMKTYPFLYCFSEGDEASECEMNLYFVNGGDVPYVALSEFLPVLAEMYNVTGKTGNGETISYKLESTLSDDYNVFIVSRPDNNSSLIIQPDDDTLIFTNYNSFGQRPGSSALVSMLSIPDPAGPDLSDSVLQMLQAARNGEEEEASNLPALLEPEDPAADHSLYVATNRIFNRRGNAFTMSLGDYNIDIVCVNGECYLPLQTMSDLFFTLRYIYFLFNGETVIADVYRGPLQDRAYEVKPEDMSQEFAMFNFNELCFFLDHFYGLKPEHRIDDFATFLMMDAKKFPQLSGTDPTAFDMAMTEVLMQYFDDLHSGLVRFSWRTGAPEGSELFAMMANLG